MLKFFTPIILVSIAIGGFFMFTKPIYEEINVLKAEVADYSEALDNSKSLDAEKDELVKKYNAIDTDDLNKLEKLLPDGVDNIKLILEIEKLAAPYGMVLRDIKYDVKSSNKELSKETGTQNERELISEEDGLSSGDNKDYGTWDLSFSVQGSYFNFLNFVRSLEKNLRIVDIASIDFSSESIEDKSLNSKQNTNTLNASNIYKYNFKIKTYWLKN